MMNFSLVHVFSCTLVQSYCYHQIAPFPLALPEYFCFGDSKSYRKGIFVHQTKTDYKLSCQASSPVSICKKHIGTKYFQYHNNVRMTMRLKPVTYMFFFNWVLCFVLLNCFFVLSSNF